MTAAINQPEMLPFRGSSALPKEAGLPKYHYNSLSRGTRDLTRVRYGISRIFDIIPIVKSSPSKSKGRDLFFLHIGCQRAVLECFKLQTYPINFAFNRSTTSVSLSLSTFRVPLIQSTRFCFSILPLCLQVMQ